MWPVATRSFALVLLGLPAALRSPNSRPLKQQPWRSNIRTGTVAAGLPKPFQGDMTAVRTRRYALKRVSIGTVVDNKYRYDLDTGYRMPNKGLLLGVATR